MTLILIKFETAVEHAAAPMHTVQRERPRQQRLFGADLHAAATLRCELLRHAENAFNSSGGDRCKGI
ncbi:MAG TPA: hypothetical protein VFP43_09650, partial [Mesorhizobium sp.]|nr:hypothetical protein [Mesorhizobium sp.]